MLYKKIGLFLIIGVIFLGSFNFAYAAEATSCKLRATISATEVTAITGVPTTEELVPTTSGLSLTGPNAGNNALLCTFGLVKWASNILFVSLGIVALVFLALGALFFITAGQNPARAQSARKYIIYAVLGLIVAALARVIPVVVRGILGV